jgi:hypothetical protein
MAVKMKIDLKTKKYRKCTVTDFTILQIDGITQRPGKRLLPLQRIASDEINVLPQNESMAPWQRILFTVGHLLSNQLVAMEDKP